MTEPSNPIGEDEMTRAADILARGGLVAVPTETVYGLAADATNPDAVARIYAAKGRPAFNPLIAHVSGMEMAGRYGDLSSETMHLLVAACWPGSLTLVVPHLGGLTPAVTAGLPTVALRHPVGAMAELARRLDRPLAAPSANTSGRVSPTTAAHVRDDLGERVDMVLDGGRCAVGVESTIVHEDGSLLREGGVTREALAALMGAPPGEAGQAIQAPGMLASHYAPQAPLRLDADTWREGEARLGFGPLDGDLNLSPAADLAEAARNLYSMLKQLDGPRPIAVAPVPHEGLGAAINDRLRRAAAPRD